jgi:hypothetical protein
LATTTISTLGPAALISAMTRRAEAAASCPAASRMPGGIAHLYRSGGCAMGATFINAVQAGFMNAGIAANYGLTTGLVQYGSNWWIDPNSPFGLGVITPPPGWSGGQSAWNAALMKTSLGGHYGPFHADDAPGDAAGQVAACGAMKPSLTNTDILLNQGAPRTQWAKAMSAYSPRITSLNTVTPSTLQSGFTFTPSSGLTPTFLTNAAKATDALSSIFASLFTSGKSGASQAYTNAICGFYGDAAMADPGFAGSLFDYTKISQLGAIMTVSALPPEFQAFLTAFYQSATGGIGAVTAVQLANDYHPPRPQTDAAPLDYEAGQIFGMWLAASVAAAQPAAFIMNSNGRVGCAGTVSNTITQTNGSNATVNGPVATGDSGGSYNAGLIVLYGPTSAPSGLQYTGTFSTTDGSVTASSAVPSVTGALAGLYLTALGYLGFNVSNAVNVLKAGGVSNPCSLTLLSTC